MGWKSMGRYLPQVAEVTRIFGDTLADEAEKRNPKLAPIVRGGLKAIEALGEAEGNTAAPYSATGNQYLIEDPYPPQQDPVLQNLLMEQELRQKQQYVPEGQQIIPPLPPEILDLQRRLAAEQVEQLAADGPPDSPSSMYEKGGSGQER